MFIMFLKFCLEMGSIELPSGFDFANWSLKHVLLWVLKCFPENWPKRIEFDAIKLSLCLEVQSENSRFWIHARAGNSTLECTLWVHVVRASGESNARAWNACIQYFACVYSPLKRGNVCSSRGRAPVEREFHAASTFAFRSSEESDARAELLCLHVRSSMDPKSRIFRLNLQA